MLADILNKMSSIDDLQELIQLVDKNKFNIPEYDYLQMCELMQKIYNKEDSDDEAYDIDPEYNHTSTNSGYIKKSINAIIVITSIVNLLMISYSNLLIAYTIYFS